MRWNHVFQEMARRERFVRVIACVSDVKGAGSWRVDDDEAVFAVKDHVRLYVEGFANEEQRGGRGPAFASRRSSRVASAAKTADGRLFGGSAPAVAELACFATFWPAVTRAPAFVFVAWWSLDIVTSYWRRSCPHDFLAGCDEVSVLEDAKSDFGR